MDAWCIPGMRVEVILCEEGLAGSRYAARVIEMDKGRAFVEFEVRCSSSARQLEGRTETVAPRRRSTRKAQRKRCCVSGTRRTIFSQSLHRLPKASLRCGCTAMFMFDERCRENGHIDAPALHAAQRLTNSDEVDVYYDDGWWLMKFMGTRRSASGTEYHVRSDLYQVERWVPADHIRPHWRRRGAKWRELDQMRKQPAQAKAPPPKDASPSPKSPGPKVAPAASARTRKAAPVGKMASPSLRDAQDGARPTSAGGGSSAPLSVGIAPPHIPGWAPSWAACSLGIGAVLGGSIGELCGQMLRQMQAREEAAWFEHPVSLVDVPDYLTVISQPMDYSTMGKKLAEGEYSANLLSFASDMRLIFSNALAYNWDPENECHQAAKQVHPAPLASTAGVVTCPAPRQRAAAHLPRTRIWFAQAQRNFEMLFAAALEAKAHLRAAEASKDGTIVGGRTAGDAVSDKVEEDEEEDEAVAEEERGGDGDGVSRVSDDSEGEGEGEDGEGTTTRLKRGGLSIEDEMAFLIKLVVASGGRAEMLDGWTIGRLSRGDKVYTEPDGVKLISRLQVVRHLHLDEAAGKRKLDAEKEQRKSAKQEEKRAVSPIAT